MRVVGEGSPTGGKPESELTGAILDVWAGVLESLLRIACFSAGGLPGRERSVWKLRP
jgi:hypothetical protein